MKQQTSKKCLCILEDEIDFARALQRMAQAKGLDCKHFADPDEILKNQKEIQQNSHCLLIDLGLGQDHPDGPIWLKFVAQTQMPPIILMTGHPAHSPQMNACKPNIQKELAGILHKPFNFAALQKILEKLEII